VRRVLGALGAAVTVCGAVFFVGMRRKTPAVLRQVKRASRRMKPLVLKKAGTAGNPNSVVRHVGRRSGTSYETPVVAARTDTGFVIALPYGDTTDWVRNVVAGGGATVVHDGAEYRTEHPEVIELTDANPYFAEREQRAHRRFKVAQALELTTSGFGSTPS
jgi:deazaflavin-dependent oxidoreductase (nitroreductase family)